MLIGSLKIFRNSLIIPGNLPVGEKYIKEFLKNGLIISDDLLVWCEKFKGFSKVV
jgi:hypothetical protein